MPVLASASRHRLKDYRHVIDIGRDGMVDRWVATRRPSGGDPTLHLVGELRADCATRTECREWFKRQCRLQARMRHPNLVVTDSFGEERGRFYFVTEYLEGQTLLAIKRRRVLSVDAELYILRNALDALHYIHGFADKDGTPMRLAHGRVGPESIFVGYDGTIKIIDFAEPPPDRTSNRDRDLAHSAPEAASGREIDCRTDVFAVGILLWEAVAGRGLWHDLADGTVLRRLELGLIPDLRCFVPNAPSDLCRVVERALSCPPEKRFEHAGAMRDALSECLARGRVAVTEQALAAVVSQAFSRDRVRVRDLVEASRPATSTSGARRMEEGAAAEENVSSTPAPRENERTQPASSGQSPHSRKAPPKRAPKVSGTVGKQSDLPTATHEMPPPAENDGSGEPLPHPYTPEATLSRTPRGSVLAIRHSVTGGGLIAKIRKRDAGLMGRAVAAAVLQHPNTARIVDVGTTGDGVSVFTIQERVEGVPLSWLLRGGETLAPRLALRLLRQVACSLAEAHARGVVHGRLWPDHVLVADCRTLGEWVKVIGYEGDKSTEAITAAPMWAAPELFEGAPPSPASDLHAAGLLLLRCLFGVAPDSDGRTLTLATEGLARRTHPLCKVDGLASAIEEAIEPDHRGRVRAAAKWIAALDAIDMTTIASSPTVEARRANRTPAVTRRRTWSAPSHRFSLENRPTIWVLGGDAGTQHESVRAALLKLGEDADVRVIPEDAVVETLAQIEKGKTIPPWVLLFGVEHVRKNDELLGRLSLVGEVSRLLVAVHPKVDDVRRVIHATGVDAHVALPRSARDVVVGINRMVERSRDVRRHYDEIRYALRDTRSQLRGLTRSLAVRQTLPPPPAESPDS